MSEKKIRIALAGNPNSGKTTLFNALTGSNQFVGNWPGVTVEKKEGRLKKHSDVVIEDLPGIYSLSPYTMEEVVSRNYLVNDKPDAILNIVDGTNLERNLYLTTQLLEVGVPVVIAVNMMDLVRKNGDTINIEQLSKSLGCPVYEISALKGTGIKEISEKIVKTASEKKPMIYTHRFAGCVEHTLAHIEEACLHNLPEEKQRWYAVKLFERDGKVAASLKADKIITDEKLSHIDNDIKACEAELNDDSESIITSERYNYIESIINKCYTKKKRDTLTLSDKIDRIVTNRWLALPIFAAVMFLFTVTSCSNEVDDTAVSTAPELEKFESVENEILKLNQSYEDAGGYNTRKIKLFKKIWRALTVAVADAGSFILSGFNVSTAVTVSKNINDIYKSFEGEVQQEALKKAPLNGLEPGSPGYIHNEAIIRLYQKYGDNLDSMDTRELVNATMQEVADITGDESYARPTKTTYDVIDIFVTKMDFNKSTMFRYNME